MWGLRQEHDESMILMKGIKGLQAAVGLLTTVPVPVGIDPCCGIPWFPMLGTALGGVVALVMYGCGTLLGWHTGGAVLAVGVMVVLTGALHVDGLADAADSCGVRGIEEKLRVMRDPHVGSFGVAAIVLTTLFKMVSIQTLSQQAFILWMILPCALSRAAQVLTLVTLPYIREAGKGKVFSDAVRPVHAVFAVLWCIGLGWWLMNGVVVWVLAGVGLVLAALLLAIKRVYGGITGDLIGAVSELTECATWGLLVLIEIKLNV